MPALKSPRAFTDNFFGFTLVVAFFVLAMICLQRSPSSPNVLFKTNLTLAQGTPAHQVSYEKAGPNPESLWAKLPHKPFSE